MCAIRMPRLATLKLIHAKFSSRHDLWFSPNDLWFSQHTLEVARRVDGFGKSESSKL
jgi:hypothetical protein